MCDPFCKHPTFLARAILTLDYREISKRKSKLRYWYPKSQWDMGYKLATNILRNAHLIWCCKATARRDGWFYAVHLTDKFKWCEESGVCGEGSEIMPYHFLFSSAEGLFPPNLGQLKFDFRRHKVRYSSVTSTGKAWDCSWLMAAWWLIKSSAALDFFAKMMLICSPPASTWRRGVPNRKYFSQCSY